MREHIQCELENLAAHLESDGDLEGAGLVREASNCIGLFMHALWIMLDDKEVVVRAADGKQALSICPLDRDEPTILIKRAAQ